MSPNKTQNFNEDITIIFICTANAIKNDARAKKILSSKKFIYTKEIVKLRLPTDFL